MALRRMTAAEGAKLDAMMDRVDAQNRARQAKYRPTAKEVAEQAAFLRGWAKGKEVRKAAPGGSDTFWRCGRWMTQLQPKTLEALAAAGHVRMTGDCSFVVVRAAP